MHKIYVLLMFLLISNLTFSDTLNSNPISELPLEKIKLPPGFSIQLWATIPDAKSLTLGKQGTVFVSSKSSGSIYAISQSNASKEKQIRIIADGLKSPSGITFYNEALYVVALNRILRFDHIENNLEKINEPQVIYENLPKESFHNTRYLAIGPDNLLYVSVGAPCDACEADSMRYAVISRITPNGDNFEVYAQGVRNSLGFDWHPKTNELWFSDIGRDWMGEDLPPDEINHASTQGLHFGFPYCHASNILDPKFGAKRGCNKSLAPTAEFEPHVSPHGIKFYSGSMFPTQYQGHLIVAEHGSWNRRAPVGFRLQHLQLENNRVVKKEIFAEGWFDNQNQKAWGRPNDMLVMPDGTLLVSDDLAGAIYQISYKTKD